MSNNSSGNNSGRNRVEVPEAKSAMDKFKMEVANELGVDLKKATMVTSLQNRQGLLAAKWYAE